MEWIGNLITATATLTGVYLTQRFSRQVNREHWLLDNKKQEYRELLTALTQAFSAVVELYSALIAHTIVVQTPAQEAEYDEIMTTAMVVVSDRLFIRREMKQINLAKRWQDLVKGLSVSEEAMMQFSSTFNGIRHDIVNCAMTIAE